MLYAAIEKTMRTTTLQSTFFNYAIFELKIYKENPINNIPKILAGIPFKTFDSIPRPNANPVALTSNPSIRSSDPA